MMDGDVTEVPRRRGGDGNRGSQSSICSKSDADGPTRAGAAWGSRASWALRKPGSCEHNPWRPDSVTGLGSCVRTAAASPPLSHSRFSPSCDLSSVSLPGSCGTWEAGTSHQSCMRTEPQPRSRVWLPWKPHGTWVPPEFTFSGSGVKDDSWKMRALRGEALSLGAPRIPVHVISPHDSPETVLCDAPGLQAVATCHSLCSLFSEGTGLLTFLHIKADGDIYELLAPSRGHGSHISIPLGSRAGNYRV